MLIKNNITKHAVKNLISNIVKIRWVIAALLFFFLVFNKVHFSSIGVYYDMFPTVSSEEEKKNYKIFGSDRSIRSDEWLIHTPRYFSQYYNDYKQKNDRVGLSPKDGLIDYYAPAKDISLIGKPFNLGYILFGNEYGLSFYFCMLEILLFMTAFEMFLILTRRSILISLAGMLLIGLAPAMQWWLIPHVAIVFVYAMAIFSLTYYFFILRNSFFKIIISCLLISALVGFTFSIYPACQIMCVFVFGFLTILTLCRDKEIIKFNLFSLFMIGFILLVSAGIILKLFSFSKDAFLLLANTEYPGNRVCVGGVSRFEDLFTSLTSLFLPFMDVNVKNNCEVATFIHFGPLFLFMFYKIRKHLQDNRDKDVYIGVFLYYLIIVEIIFMCAGFPLIISQLTLFKYVNRMEMCYGFTSTIFTVWGLNVIWRKKNIFTKTECIIYVLVYAILMLSFIDLKLKEYVSFSLLLVEVLVLSLMILLGFLGLKKSFFLFVSCFMFMSGFTINPICVGISPITNHSISKFIQQRVNENESSIWISLGNSYIGSFLMANGARMIPFNSFYPDKQEWKLLNINQKYYDLYNRYCHRLFYLSDKEQYIKLVNPDLIQIFINYETLKKLNVKYIAIDDEYLKTLNWPKTFHLKKIFTQDHISILKMS